jgi:hypothetical protein
MEAQQFFNEKDYSASLQALNELADNANYLASVWDSLCEEELTLPIYTEWLSNRELIYTTFQKESEKKHGRLWKTFTADQKRPPLGDKFQRYFSTAEHYSNYGGVARVTVADLTFDKGRASVTDETKLEIRKRCTFELDQSSAIIYSALENLCSSLNICNGQIAQKYGVGFGIGYNELPLRQEPDGTCKVDPDKLQGRLSLFVAKQEMAKVK